MWNPEPILDLVRRIAAQTKFRDWEFDVISRGEVTMLRVRFKDAAGVEQKGRKWFISEHSTASEVVQTLWLAVATALEHEAREEFTWRGEAVMGPHFDVWKLHGLARSKAFDERVG